MTPIQASKKSNEKEVYSNFQDRRDKELPKYKVGQLVRTADIKRVFSKGNNYIGADYTSQISPTSFRFASFDRLDLTDIIRHLSRSLVAMLLTGIVSLASRYNYCSTTSRLFFTRFARR